MVIMPTGGGKSLCYQLPALAVNGLTLVVSPLIALMKDQVDGLQANGIAAGFINSSLNAAAISRVQQMAEDGALRVLYVAPERIGMSAFQRFLAGLDVSLIAIDEAHCISEWGHDFRPDYRNLAELRDRFPDTPVMALTATATDRVRDDIADQLRLGDCPRFISSFDRANLTYVVRPKQRARDALLELVAHRRGESAIVYCFSRRDTESVADWLTKNGHPALAYHAGLDPELRRLTQERFIDGEVPIVAATIAFGMGIDKPDVRLVVHYAMPKSLESYYQETGRAGRDGQPSDCVMLFSEGDRHNHDYFSRQLEDPEARAKAERQLQQVADYARLDSCRRKHLLAYFGEAMEGERCGRCDVCMTERHSTDVTVAAQKVLSAVIRTGERFGIAYVCDVLLGKRSARIRDLGHDHLSVFGIVADYDGEGLRQIASGLTERGLLAREDGRYGVISVTPLGREWLRGTESLHLELRSAEPAPSRAPRQRVLLEQAPDYDADLFEALRVVRRSLADAGGVPAFVVFNDATLRRIAAARPTNREAMLRVSGVGPAKLDQYADPFLAAIRSYAESHGKADQTDALLGRDPLRTSENGGERGRPERRRGGTYDTTQALLAQNLSISQMAEQRNLSEGTIISHLERIAGQDVERDLEYLRPNKARLAQVKEALDVCGNEFLKPVMEYLGPEVSYHEIRLARIFLRQEQSLAD